VRLARGLVPAVLVLLAVPWSAPSYAVEDGGIGIRLLEAPADRRDDPRASRYVIDHVAPGTTVVRAVAVSNDTGRTQHVDLYAGPATIEDGAFVGGEPGRSNELTSWTSVDRTSLDLQPGKEAEIVLRIDVPADASAGERYGVVWASVTGESSQGVTEVNRVGVRLYLSVGAGGEPASDFEVHTLTAGRDDAGVPFVAARVENTGGRALDLSGSVRLTEGPASLTAGPFTVDSMTTLAPGDSGDVTVPLVEGLPNGPWHARLVLRSGTLQRAAEADLTFPGPGETAPPVDVSERPWWQSWTVAGLAGLVAVLGILMVLVVLRRRRTATEAPA
jgi:hypothetical protein